MLIRADIEAMLIAIIDEAVSAEYPQLSGRVADQPPQNWGKGDGPFIAVRQIGTRVDPHCLAQNSPNPVEEATVQVDILGSGRSPKDATFVIDPLTGRPHTTAKGEAQQLAQVVASAIESSSGHMSDTGAALGGRIFSRIWAPETWTDRARYILTGTLRVRSKGKPLTNPVRKG